MAVWRHWSGTALSKETIMIPCWFQDSLERAKLSPQWPELVPRWAQEGLRNYLGSSGRCPSPLFGPNLAPSWAVLGPPWPFLGGPGGHLEAKFGLGRLDLGVQGGQELRCQKHQNNQRKFSVFGRVLGARNLQEACKVALWRSSCGLEGLKTATWKSSWLLTWFNKGK